MFCRRTGVAVASDGRCICTDIRGKAVSCVPDSDGTGRDPLNRTGIRHGLLRVRIAAGSRVIIRIAEGGSPCRRYLSV
jgi:hypothetical protein